MNASVGEEKKRQNSISAGDIILRGLNEEQQKAVQKTDGPLLILAGAGSGKTRTLVHRIAYLIAEKGVAPWNILSVTFTNKAAKHMQEQMKSLLRDTTHLPTMGTFHSICARLLRREITTLGYQDNFIIYDSGDQQTLVKKTMKDLGYDTKQVSASAVHWKISTAKNMLITPAEFEETISDALDEVALKVYPIYQKELKAHNALDFDDLIMKTVELLTTYPDVLKKYQELWKYVMVDEYQDTNKAQYQLIHLLSQEHKNICVVGDDFQSIYAWRCADIRNILEFEQDYPGAVTVLLEQNYRSSQNILDASNAVIAKNTNQKEKKLWTTKKAGKPIMISEVENAEGEGRYIVEHILGIKNQEPPKQSESEEITYDRSEADPDSDDGMVQPGQSILDRVMGAKWFAQSQSIDLLRNKMSTQRNNIDFSQYVVLYRTNAQSRALEEIFLQCGVPYTLIGGTRFYERKEIKDVLAYIRVLFNPNDWVSLERIINIPARGIGDRTWFVIEQFCRQNDLDVMQGAAHAIPGVQNARLGAFVQFVDTLKSITEIMESLTPTEIVDLLLKKIGYKEYILTTSETREKGESRWENVQELKNVTKKFDGLRGQEGIETFLEEIALVTDQDSVRDDDTAVRLMTVHAAKGLEFPVVFVTGMEEGLFPHSRALTNPQEMEEERRLCYVALTRAIEEVHLLFASQRLRYGTMQVNPPSRFLDDIPPEFVEWV